MAMNMARTTHATGERKNERSSLERRMRKVRMPDGNVGLFLKCLASRWQALVSREAAGSSAPVSHAE
jgi:hypothetical protein